MGFVPGVFLRQKIAGAQCNGKIHAKKCKSGDAIVKISPKNAIVAVQWQNSRQRMQL
jgi:hypothetical protein